MGYKCRTMTKNLLFFGLFLTAPLAAAPLVNATGLLAPGAQITFSEVALTQGDLITNQYAGLGATFSGANLHYQSISTFLGLPPDHLFNGVTEPNATPAPGSSTTFLISFASSVSAASLQMLFLAPGPTDSTQLVMRALAGGIGQETLTVNDPDLNNFSNTYYGFTGINFDALEITVNYAGAPATRPGVALDNLAFNAVAGAPELSERGWLPLLSAGLLLALSRRR